MSTQLSLYNEALRLIGERNLANLSENRVSRRLLDDVWNDGVVQFCLEQGFWDFAMRAAKFGHSTAVDPTFGFDYAFEIPTDWIRTAGIAADENFNLPLTQYLEEVGYWLTNVDPLYVRYISNDDQYGNDLTRWPQTFSKYVASVMALEIAPSLTLDEKRVLRINAVMIQRRTDARSKDAMNGPTTFPPQGGWTSSRQGRASRQRGNRNQLIG